MTRQTTPFIPVILSGGSGTRLWPLSRQEHPKPFIKLDEDESLLRKTFLRIKTLPGVTELLTITNANYFFKTLAEYDGENEFEHTFLLEPCARNTAPSIALAVQKIIRTHGEDAIILIVPADHLIEETPRFANYCAKAQSLAHKGRIVTFGIKPTQAETGYGYIEKGDADDSLPDAFTIKAFREKPNKASAAAYLKSQRHLWNAGIFCFKAKTMAAEIEKYAPELNQIAKRCLTNENLVLKNAHAYQLALDEFAQFTAISIDYAIMEKTQVGSVIACDLAWHDIGSWEAYKNIFPSDANGNTRLADSILIDSSNNLLHSKNRLISTIGIHDLAIIDTEDALLIAERNRLQEVKEIVAQLKENHHQAYADHKTVFKPWGSYTIIESSQQFQIKRIHVKPFKALSLQTHQKRSEHWVVVKGTATVINGDGEYTLTTNESTFIALGAKHRLSNNTNEELILIEIQTGHYFGEDDIIRYEDHYGRVLESHVETSQN